MNLFFAWQIGGQRMWESHLGELVTLLKYETISKFYIFYFVCHNVYIGCSYQQENGVKRIEWSEEKNKQLQTERNLSFEAVVVAIEQGKLIDIVPNPSRHHPHQNVLVVEVDDYLVLVPFIEDEEKIFFKTAFRSRKVMKNRLRSHKNETT